MQDNEKKPALRFKGFTDPWEQRKVGTLIEDYTEKTVTQNQYPVLTSSQQQGIVLQEDYFADRQVTTDNNVGYYVLPKGYFTYRSRSDTDVFVFNRNNIVDKGIISYYYPVFAPKSCDSNFLLRRLNHGIKKQLSMAAEGTGQKVLAHAKFKNMAVDVPSQSEQEKIGTILEELDTLITLHQRKYEKLVNIKKSMLDKMFPQNGASVPEIRFKGFTDPWEQRKLGEIAVFSKGVGYSKNDLCEEGTPIILYGRLYTKYETCVFDVDTFVKEKAGSVYSKGGEVIVPASGETAEDISIASVVVKPGILLGGDLNIVSPTAEYDSAFLALTISSGATHKYLSSLAQGKSVVHLHNSDIQSVSAKFPTKREQEKIHLIFGKIDTLITLHQRKLEKLQNIKKSCLEKMFV